MTRAEENKKKIKAALNRFEHLAEAIKKDLTHGPYLRKAQNEAGELSHQLSLIQLETPECGDE